MEWSDDSSIDDFEMNEETCDMNEGEVRRSTRVSKPVERYGNLALLSNCIVSDDDLPVSATKALNGRDCEKWKQAMIDELESMKENHVWVLVNHPENCKTLKVKRGIR